MTSLCCLFFCLFRDAQRTAGPGGGAAGLYDSGMVRGLPEAPSAGAGERGRAIVSTRNRCPQE